VALDELAADCFALYLPVVAVVTTGLHSDLAAFHLPRSVAPNRRVAADGDSRGAVHRLPVYRLYHGKTVETHLLAERSVYVCVEVTHSVAVMLARTGWLNVQIFAELIEQVGNHCV